MVNKNILSSLSVLIVAANTIAASKADGFNISKMFSDNMVLQRGMKVPVWGWGRPGESVRITFNGQEVKTVVGRAGKWMVKLNPMKAGGPFVMTVTGATRIKFKNVMIGDVWLCGGQSNMEWRVHSSKNSGKEIANAKYPQIRLFTCPRATNQVRQEHLPQHTGKWQICSPSTVGSFSGAGYFFGRDLHQAIKVPVGLIHSSLGGTAVELWIPRTDLEKDPGSRAAIQKFDKQCDDPALQEKLKTYREVTGKVSQYRNMRSYKPGAWVGLNFNCKDWDSFDPAKSKAQSRTEYALLNLRKTINIPAGMANKDLTIYICYPMVYGYSKVYFNGHEAKRISKWLGHHYKAYQVKAEYVKPGQAVIAEHLFSYKYGKQFREARGRCYITAIGKKDQFKLSGTWKIKILDLFSPVSEPMHHGHRKALNGLYNAMINPIAPFAIKGAIWYQGERNVSDAFHYRTLLPLMIASWRKEWGQGDFPFLIVQLANYGKPVNAPGESTWAELREAQALTAENVPGCGLATAIDIGEEKNIHPTNKQDVGARLSLVARKLVYGDDIICSGPVYHSMEIKGNKIILKFKHTGRGLIARNGKLKGFAIAGKDKKFHWADAIIKGSTVIVSSPEISNPAAVRYAWSQNPKGCNLYNKEGLPAFPFRTDNWPLSTQNK